MIEYFIEAWRLKWENRGTHTNIVFGRAVSWFLIILTVLVMT